MKILYRISSNSYKKPRLTEATKEFCLENFIKNVVHDCDEMILIGDNVDAPLKSFLGNSFDSPYDTSMSKILGMVFVFTGTRSRFESKSNVVHVVLIFLAQSLA